MKKPKRFNLISQFEKEIKGNIWDFMGECNVICITINLFMKNGKNIMGAGIAKEAKDRFEGIDHDIAFVYDTFGFGTYLMATEYRTKRKGDIITGINCTHIFTFPTKPAWIRVNKSRSNVLPYYRTKPFVFAGKDIPGYMGYSDIELIKKSASSLKSMIEASMFLKRVILPKPGCSHGGLKWEDVREELKEVGLYQLDAIQFIEKG